jgi:RNA polymerase sigma-70 factor (ECF subfamily)
VDDTNLLEALRCGREGALAEVSQRYRGRLVSYAARILKDETEAEDVAQEVLLKAAGSAGPREGTALGPWLYTVTGRAAVDRLRARKVEARALRAVPPRTVAAPATPIEGSPELAAALHDLDDPYRSALILRYLEGLDFREVAARLGTIERTARTWVGRGLTRLRAALQGRMP